MTESQSKSLVWIRTFAMLSIVVCHLFQAYHNRWADIFNMGVQVFLVMSGYLYGYKSITKWREWGWKRIKKIYLPYIVFLIAVIPFYVLFHKEALSWKSLPFYFANLQGFRLLVGGSFGRIEGLRHVWFITAIMCSYLATPFLQKMKKQSILAMPVLLVLVAVAYLVLPSLRYVFVLSWVYLYAFGYLFVNLSKRWKLFYIGLCVVVLVYLIYLCLNLHWVGYRHPYQYPYRLIHDIVGVFVVIVGVWLLSMVKELKVPKVISFLDKYSFQVFIVHFIIMCGPFSMAHITPYIWLNIIIMLLVTAAATYLFVKVVNFINGIWEKKCSLQRKCVVK